MASKTDEAVFREVADSIGISCIDVKNVVASFFGAILSESRRLPFDNPRKIYDKATFEKLSTVQNIPYIGRFGPSYNRYLKWRANEAKGINMVPRKMNKKKMTPEEIESLAEIVLNGGKFEPKKKTNNYKRVWLVREEGKKLARQVITKEEIE